MSGNSAGRTDAKRSNAITLRVGHGKRRETACRQVWRGAGMEMVEGGGGGGDGTHTDSTNHPSNHPIIQFNISSRGIGRWTGIGFSRNGRMPGSDIVTGWVYDQKVGLRNGMGGQSDRSVFCGHKCLSVRVVCFHTLFSFVTFDRRTSRIASLLLNNCRQLIRPIGKTCSTLQAKWKMMCRQVGSLRNPFISSSYRTIPNSNSIQFAPPFSSRQFHSVAKCSARIAQPI